MTPAERLLDEESSYAAVADELNDGEPGDATLDDLDPEVVASARTYAERNGLSWPPELVRSRPGATPQSSCREGLDEVTADG